MNNNFSLDCGFGLQYDDNTMDEKIDEPTNIEHYDVGDIIYIFPLEDYSLLVGGYYVVKKVESGGKFTKKYTLNSSPWGWEACAIYLPDTDIKVIKI
jgi:hypothetical protein